MNSGRHLRADLVDGLEWLELIGTQTRTLRAPVPRTRTFFGDDSVAWVGRLERRDGPLGALLRHRWTGDSLLTGDRTDPLRSRAPVDVLVPGVRRNRERTRFRAFRLGLTGRVPLAVAGIERPDPSTATAMVDGPGVQRRFREVGAFVVPRCRDQGSCRRDDRVLDWVVEDMLPGRPVTVAERQDAAAEALHLLAATWTRLPLRHHPLPTRARERARTAFAALLERAPAGTWPHGVPEPSLGVRVHRLLTSTRPVTVGPTHGDPTLSNLLRMPDGRLGLVDWELARERLLGHDVGKVLRTTPDPRALLAGLVAPDPVRAAMARVDALPWRHQVAQALLVFLSGWEHRHRRSVAAGHQAYAVASLRRTVELVDLLTD
ncbi:aminoglycoside phosphotransferase family protein [Desertihabitans aurantiacus]|uniref:hypothetical protein n=1 Tax=Desertihabitans aurantiacus TaxID=2282477 RepID=UPI000DF747AA|nr:hypothetical protein [Desertihabitans aurantiacus]